MEKTKLKKLKNENLGHDSEDEQESDECMFDEEQEDEDDTFINQEIEVEFEALEPTAADLDGIKRMLKQLFLKENVNVTEIANALIENKEYTTVFKQVDSEDDESEDANDDVFGVTSLLDFSDETLVNSKVAENIRSYLTAASKKSKNDELQNIFENVTKLGLVINERFVNLPAKLCIPSFNELVTVMGKKKCSLDYLVMIVKVLVPKKNKSKNEDSEVLFLNPEEELFEEGCDFCCSINASELCDASCRDGHWDDTDREYSPFRRVLVFKFNSWFKVVENLKQNL